MQTLEDALPFTEHWVGVGLDSTERDRPPLLFKDVYARAAELGKHLVGHAGEEGPPEYVRQGLELGWERIDHGNASINEPRLVEHLARHRIPLTMCPLSNMRLKVITDVRDHPLPELMRRGVVVTTNSDDPAYFGGYVGANYTVLGAAGMGLSDEEIVQVARNSFEASFLPEETKRRHIAEVDAVATRLLGSS